MKGGHVWHIKDTFTDFLSSMTSEAPSPFSHSEILSKLPSWSLTTATQRNCSSLHSCTSSCPTVDVAAFRMTQSPGCN